MTNEPSRVVFARQPVQLVPERRGDLEVVALVAHAVEKGPVARELDQLARRVGADRLLRLAVQVAPVGPQRRLGGDAQRVADGRARSPSASRTSISQVARLGDATGRRSSARARRAASKTSPASPRDRPAGAQRERRRSTWSLGLPQLVLALEAEAEGLADAAQGRQHRLPGHRRAGDDRDRRLQPAIRHSCRSRTASTSTRNSKVGSTKVCTRMPGEPWRRSPKRTVIVSPSRRKPRMTRIIRVLSHGRILSFGSYTHVEHRAVRRLDGGVVRPPSGRSIAAAPCRWRSDARS